MRNLILVFLLLFAGLACGEASRIDFPGMANETGADQNDGNKSDNDSVTGSDLDPCGRALLPSRPDAGDPDQYEYTPEQINDENRGEAYPIFVPDGTVDCVEKDNEWDGIHDEDASVPDAPPGTPIY